MKNWISRQRWDFSLTTILSSVLIGVCFWGIVQMKFESVPMGLLGMLLLYVHALLVVTAALICIQFIRGPRRVPTRYGTAWVRKRGNKLFVGRFICPDCGESFAGAGHCSLCTRRPRVVFREVEYDARDVVLPVSEFEQSVRP